MKNFDKNTGEKNIGGFQMKFDYCFYLQAGQEVGIWGENDQYYESWNSQNEVKYFCIFSYSELQKLFSEIKEFSVRGV